MYLVTQIPKKIALTKITHPNLKMIYKLLNPPEIKVQSPTLSDLKLEAGLCQLQRYRSQSSEFNKLKQRTRRLPRSTGFGGPRPRRWPEIRKLTRPQALTWTAILRLNFKSPQSTTALTLSYFTTRMKTLQRLNTKLFDPADH